MLFTGHRIDDPDRAIPRFPASAEETVRQLISNALESELGRYLDCDLRAISSGASGGDILFLESCIELGIPAEIYLAKAEDEFIAASVADAGPAWIERFRALTGKCPVYILDDESDPDLNAWQRTNLWMLETAQSISPDQSTLITLWDGESGDGSGGTQDMTLRALAAGIDVVPLDWSRVTGIQEP